MRKMHDSSKVIIIFLEQIAIYKIFPLFFFWISEWQHELRETFSPMLKLIALRNFNMFLFINYLIILLTNFAQIGKKALKLTQSLLC